MKQLKGNQENYRKDQRRYQAQFSNGGMLSSPLPLFYIWNILKSENEVRILKLILVKG